MSDKDSESQGFDAVIRFRVPRQLKDSLTEIARRRFQKLSDYMRQRCIDIVEADSLSQVAPAPGELARKLAKHGDEGVRTAANRARKSV